MDKKYYIYLFLLSIGLFVIGFLYGINNSAPTDNESNIDLSGGLYIRMVYIGSSKCVYSNNRHTHKMVSDIKKRLESSFKETGVGFVSTGISTDRSSKEGLEFLKKSGPYNEILVGGGSFNLGLIKYVSGSTSTPKIIFFLEEYDTELIGLNISNFSNAQKRLNIYNGQYEIEDLDEFLKNSSRERIFQYFGLENKNM